MHITYWDLGLYFFIYAFLGWVIEVATMSVLHKKFCNRGFLNLPFCLTYGVMMDILLVMYPTMYSRYVLQFVVTVIVASTVEYLGGTLAKSVLGKNLWKYDRNNIFGGEKKGILYSAGLAAILMLVIYVVHPLFFIAIHLIPVLVEQIICIVLGTLIFLDFITIGHAIWKKKRTARGKAQEDLQKNLQKGKQNIGQKIDQFIWGRLEKAYPGTEEAEKEKSYTFAKGMCLDKLIWIFLICAVVGDIVETIFCGVVDGKWMRRSSVLYGPFSLVWGAGAALLAIVLQKLSDKEDRYIFIAGFFFGGVYEYFCSVFLELAFGTIFWDYSDFPFNIGGRINLLYCIFWGILALVWVKICYPHLSKWIEKIPHIAGKIITWVAIFFLVCDALLTACALHRYSQRQKGKEAETVIEEFMDYQYPDVYIEKTWRNMKLK